jgi:hypothetical protein
VVGVQVVRDVAIFTCPSLERLKLAPGRFVRQILPDL